MYPSEIGVILGGVALIAFILWYFFGERLHTETKQESSSPAA